MAEAPIRIGTVVSFDEPRGLGEVQEIDGSRLAFHCASIADGSRRVEVGTPVAYVVEYGMTGRPEARRLTKFASGSLASIPVSSAGSADDAG